MVIGEGVPAATTVPDVELLDKPEQTVLGSNRTEVTDVATSRPTPLIVMAVAAVDGAATGGEKPVNDATSTSDVVSTRWYAGDALADKSMHAMYTPPVRADDIQVILW